MIQADAKVKYVDTTSLGGLRKMRSLLRKRSSDFFCLNDGSFPEVSAEDRAAAVRTFLDEYFPVAAVGAARSGVSAAAARLGLRRSGGPVRRR